MKFDVDTKVVNKLFDNGYEEQILDIVMCFQDDSTRELSDIPLSPNIMSDSGEQIILTSKVMEEYQKLVSIISSPETAQEIPYFLLGDRKSINNQEVIIIDDIEFVKHVELDDLRVSQDVDRFKELVSNDSHSIISIGHTHGNVDEIKKNYTLARNIPRDIVEKYKIRDAGLNLSVSDIWQHEAFKQIASQIGKKEILQTVIMFNGDIVVVGDNISKCNNIQASLANGEMMSIPTGSDNINMQLLGGKREKF